MLPTALRRRGRRSAQLGRIPHEVAAACSKRAPARAADDRHPGARRRQRNRSERMGPDTRRDAMKTFPIPVRIVGPDRKPTTTSRCSTSTCRARWTRFAMPRVPERADRARHGRSARSARAHTSRRSSSGTRRTAAHGPRIESARTVGAGARHHQPGAGRGRGQHQARRARAAPASRRACSPASGASCELDAADG